MFKPGYRQIHLLNFSGVGKPGEFWHEGEKRILKPPKIPNYHCPFMVPASVFDHSLNAFHAMFMIHPEDYETNFLELFTLLIYKEDRILG